MRYLRLQLKTAPQFRTPERINLQLYPGSPRLDYVMNNVK